VRCCGVVAAPAIGSHPAPSEPSGAAGGIEASLPSGRPASDGSGRSPALGLAHALCPLLPNEQLRPWVHRPPSLADDGIRLPLGLAFVGSDCDAQFGGFLHLSFRSECPNRFIGDPVSPLSRSGGEREQNPSQFVLIANVWPRRPSGLFSAARLRPGPCTAARVGNPYRPGRSDRATSVSLSQQFPGSLRDPGSEWSTAAGTETVTHVGRKPSSHLLQREQGRNCDAPSSARLWAHSSSRPTPPGTRVRLAIITRIKDKSPK
jgi:hypothetical protein